ncbi:MAG: hypothetical protein HYR73_07830 [Candidatus Eisenbacteria bacterium]|nr:hypothetical protein [Candidatus Eisenbacteria bacterium]
MLRREPPVAGERAAPAAPARPGASERTDPTSEVDRMPDLPDDLPSVDAEAARPLPPLREAWWVVALDELRTNLKLQIGAAAVAALLGAIVMWPRSEPAVSLSTLKKHVDQFDGRAVTVHGRVCDVFPLGGGWAFFLRQGRDSIVVFTSRSRPVMNQSLTITGTISTGYLDGLPRQSIFELAH